MAWPSLIPSDCFHQTPTVFLSFPFHSALTLFAFLLKISDTDMIFSSTDNILDMLTIRYYKFRLTILCIQHWPMPEWKSPTVHPVTVTL